MSISIFQDRQADIRYSIVTETKDRARNLFRPDFP
jgi:hypothetical protein